MKSSRNLSSQNCKLKSSMSYLSDTQAEPISLVLRGVFNDQNSPIQEPFFKDSIAKRLPFMH